MLLAAGWAFEFGGRFVELEATIHCVNGALLHGGGSAIEALYPDRRDAALVQFRQDTLLK